MVCASFVQKSKFRYNQPPGDCGTHVNVNAGTIEMESISGYDLNILTTEFGLITAHAFHNKNVLKQI
jgi:hypothetical protein